jgi:hypothetical protein
VDPAVWIPRRCVEGGKRRVGNANHQLWIVMVALGALK